MRLIDADSLLLYVDRVNNCGLGKKKSIEYITKYINNMPTAYDIDSVVKEYEKEINKCNAELTPNCETIKMYNLCSRRQAFFDAIRILKKR